MVKNYLQKKYVTDYRKESDETTKIASSSRIGTGMHNWIYPTCGSKKNVDNTWPSVRQLRGSTEI